MDPLRIALVSHSYIDSAYRGKLPYLAEANELHLISPSAYLSPYGWQSLDRVAPPGTSITGFPIRFASYKRTSTRWFLQSFDLGFRSIAPDIIQVENEQHSWITTQVVNYRRWFAPGARIVNFFWDNMTPSEQGIKGQWLERLAGINRRSIDFFMSGNRRGREVLLEKGIAPERVEVIPQSGLDPETFRPYPSAERQKCRRELGVGHQDFVVGFIGRFVEEKGLLDLVDAAGCVDTGSPRAVSLLLIGKGKLEAEIRRRCAERSIKLAIHPPCANGKVPDFLNAMDVVCLASQSTPSWEEQFGRLLTEAMACGVAVVGSDTGEIPNVIGEAGVIVRQRSAQQLARALHELREHEGYRKDLADRGRSRVLQNFTNQAIARRNLDIYERVMATDGTRVAVPA
jgi:glycosyltransferase involved in cell wall biosynthesis